MSTTIKFTATSQEPVSDWSTLVVPLPDEYIKTTYIDTGLVVDHGITVDDKTLSYWFVFKDASAIDTWMDDPELLNHREARNQLLVSENIPYTVEIS
jgi:hypothetical protein